MAHYCVHLLVVIDQNLTSGDRVGKIQKAEKVVSAEFHVNTNVFEFCSVSYEIQIQLGNTTYKLILLLSYPFS